MRITHQQIADKLGVSRTLVTGVLHGTGRFAVSDITRAKIELTAREMGYQPRNMTTHTIAYLMQGDWTHSSVELSFVMAAENALREKGYRLTVVNTSKLEDQALADVINPKTVDGVMLTYWSAEKFGSIISPRLPSVLLSEEEVGEEVEQVCVNIQGTAKVLLEHLRGHGHRRVALFTGRHGKSFFVRVANATKAAGRELGWPTEDILAIDNLPIQSGSNLLKLLETDKPPTAAIVIDVEHAVSVYCHLLAAGYKVPDDISIISMFECREFHIFSPPITATDAGGQHLAGLAVRRLLEKINMPETIPQHTKQAGALIERASVGPAKR